MKYIKFVFMQKLHNLFLQNSKKTNRNFTNRDNIMKLTEILAGVALAGTLALPAMAEDPTFFRIGTGGAGGTYFPIGGTIANGISSPPGSRACDDGGQ